ncbi:alpha/beta hydrolase [Paucibacter sp. R3-3]|uniref:Alpha/beta hydrolase n=1 Tax=Roseateles agri TaxID=3098619 RepID=A0ABU5DCM4_9BURK|nr:alpha/beta hydrolase [Paucibacter sp. R3-3]MDY0744023.1 alpha/beta hydrolase [Paucibacter sp. R3-3]
MASKISTAVLVHGAWADGSSWGSVIGSLRAAGLNVVVPQLPLTSLADDVAALERTLERVDGPVVLVGHAYGGAVIAEARSDKVQSLAYVAAIAPDEGETVAQVFGRAPPHPQAPPLAPDTHGLVWLPLEAFGRAVAPNASDELQAQLAAVQRPIALACITTPVGRPRWKDVPAWYLVAEQDRMILRDTQEFMAMRMGATIVSHPVDHVPSLTAPELVTYTILAAVRTAEGELAC